MKTQILFAAITLSFMTILSNANADDSIPQTTDSLFPMPDIIKENVAFWKKVYTEWSVHEGVLHDRDYPSIIYTKISGVNGCPAPALIKRSKEQVAASLKIIATQPESTWTKQEKDIADLFKAHAPEGALRDAEERIRFQLGQADRFKEGLERSGMYLDTIRSIMKQYGVPERIAFLPHVESSFNTAAYSKVGAAGLWQFMRSTGRVFKMQINYTIDQRRDPIVATRSAAMYLSSAYRELGTWPLAITSYNHGLNGMRHAVEVTGSRDIGVIIKNYRSPSFQFASSNFYACFLAASSIAQHPQDYFPTIHLMPRIHYKDITLSNYIAPQVLCKFLKVPFDQFTSINPAIRPAIFSQNKRLPKGFTIHIPSTTLDEQVSMETIPDSLKSNEPDRPQYYRVNRGDNLYSIATRLGVPVNDLAAENAITHSSRLHAGQVLRVPSKAIPSTPPLAAAPVSQNSIPKSSSATPAPTQPPSEPAVTQALSTVSDTPIAIPEVALADSASSFKDEIQPRSIDSNVTQPPLPVAAPVKTEKKLPKPISPVKAAKPQVKVAAEQMPDSLKEIVMTPAIPEQTTQPSQRPSVPADFDVSVYGLDITLSPVGNAAEIHVSIDETVGHYADWLGISTAELSKLNNMRHAADIRMNKRFLIPIKRQDALEQFVSARLEYHMAVEEDFYGQFKVATVKQRIINRGETLWDICNGNEGDNALPLWLFKKYNKQLDLNKLMPGMTVWIPIVVEKTETDNYDDSVEKANLPYSEPIHQVPQYIKRVP